MSEIQQFYNGTNILITGGTGFVGKILIEKLLRSTDCSRLYLLVREKNGQSVDQRLDHLFNDIIFEKLIETRPYFRRQIVGLNGDCSVSGWGLKIADRERLFTSSIQVVFHVAATVRFDEHLKTAFAINVNGTRDLLELCRRMDHLKAIVHISTAYSNCHLGRYETITEEFFEYPHDFHDLDGLLEKLSPNEIDKITGKLLGKWPNTYTFTKALGEALIRTCGAGLPIAIFRPGIVISTYQEPVAGWIDNLYGPTGVCAGVASGLLRTFHADSNIIADIVPVDLCVAGIIAAGWDLGRRPGCKQKIFNYVSSLENPITWGEYCTLNLIHGTNYPLKKSLWTINFCTINNYHLYLMYRFFVHLVPAFFVDLWLVLSGRRPRLFTMYSKIHKFSNVISYFCTRRWQFTNENTIRLWDRMSDRDKQLFPFSLKTVHWLMYFRTYFMGMRIYLMQDPLCTLGVAKKRKIRFDLLHVVIKSLFYFVVITLGFVVVAKVFLQWERCS